jgi:hypothetical protein
MDNHQIYHLFLLAIGVGGGLLIAKISSAKSRKSPGPFRFTTEEAVDVGEAIGINWRKSLFNVDEFRRGLSVELEHGTMDSRTNITDDDLSMTGKIAWAHLNELPDYYTRLAKMEEE